MAANSGSLRAPLFYGVRWLCIELLAETGHVLNMWYTLRHVCVIFLMMSDFEIQRVAYCSCLLFASS